VDAIRLGQPMHITLAEYVLGIVASGLQCFIGVVLFRRKMFRRFPAFTAYTVAQVVTEVILLGELFSGISSLKYAYTFYPLQFLAIALAFAVIYEIFRMVLEPYDALRRVWRFLFLAGALIFITIGVLWVLYGSGPQSDRLTQSMYLSLRSLRVVQVGLLLLLFTISGSLGLTWRAYSFGLALGYGTYAIVDLVLTAMRLHYGDEVWKLYSVLTSLAYSVTIVIWAVYILQPQELAQPVRVIPYNDIAKWNEKLEELLKRKAA